jgi:translation initiation factor IF-3
MMMSCSVASASVAPVMAARAASAAASTRATIIARAANPTASRAHARLSSRAAHSHAGLALAVAAGPTHAQRISVLVEARGRGRRGGGGRRGRGRRPWRRDMNTGPRRNEDIDLAETRVMDEEKEFIGLMSSEEALALAEEAGLDLVLVSPDAKPPVCRIMNYSKFKYENEKKARETRKKAAASRVELKELKMRYNIDVHDYGVRLKAAQKFLGQGDRIKVTCQFRGRENEFRDIGRDMFMRFVDDVGADLGAIDGAPSMEGNRMVMLMSPVKEKKAIAQDGPSRRKKLTRKEKEAMAAEAAANPSSEDDDDEEYDDEEGSWDEDDEEGSWDEDDEADEDESVEEEEEEVMVFSKKN